MISAFAIINIFIQVLTAGITFAGAYNFFSRYIEKKKREDIFLSLVFLTFAVFTSLTIVSQLMYMLGQRIDIRFVLYRCVAIDMVAGAAFLAYFIKEKFSMKGTLFFQLFLVLCVIESVFISHSALNLVQNIKMVDIDPSVHFLTALSPELFWVPVWLFAGLQFLLSARAAKEPGEANIFNVTGISSMLIFLSFLLSFYYSKNGEPYYLFGSWAIYLFAATGLFIGNVISPKEEIAKFPLSYLRTRILYKLILILILSIIILLEATTVATINLNQLSLQKAIKNNYLTTVMNMADKIDYTLSSRGEMDKKFIQGLINQETKGKRYVYVVSSDGRLFMGPDPGAVGMDISSLDVVKKVLSGKAGAGEYNSEFFDQAEDKAVVGAYAPVKKYNLGVILEEPKWEAFSEVRVVSSNSLIFVIVGIILTVSVGIFFTRTIEIPIRELITGTQAVRRGDLTYKIKDRFPRRNRAAG